MRPTNETKKMIINKECLLLLFDMESFPQEIKNSRYLKSREYLCLFNVKQIIREWMNKVESLEQAGRRLSPNLIMFCIKQQIFELEYRNKKCSIKYKNKNINIRHQDYFSYLLIKTIFGYLWKSDEKIHKQLLDNLFINDSFYGIRKFTGSIEVSRNTNDNKYRTDLEFKFNIEDNQYVHIVEYLEKKGHSKNFNRQEDRFRLINLMSEHNDIIAAAFFDEKKWNFKKNNFFKDFVKKLIKKLCDIYFLKNKREYVINELEIVTSNRLFSQVLYDGYYSQDEYEINKSLVDHIIMWKNKHSKEKYWTFFKKQIKPININLIEQDDDISFDDCDDSDFDIDNDQEIKQKYFYEKRNNEYYFNWDGLNNYLMSIEIKYLFNSSEKIKINNFYKNITHSFINVLEKRYEIEKNINKTKIWE